MKYTTFCRGINWDCAVRLKKYNEIYLLIKYIKSFLWRVAEHLSYIEDAWCIKVNGPLFFLEAGSKRSKHTILKIANSTILWNWTSHFSIRPTTCNLRSGYRIFVGTRISSSVQTSPGAHTTTRTVQWVLDRSGFTVKLKLQNPSLGTGLFQGPGRALNNYLLSYQILYSYFFFTKGSSKIV